MLQEGHASVGPETYCITTGKLSPIFICKLASTDLFLQVAPVVCACSVRSAITRAASACDLKESDMGRLAAALKMLSASLLCSQGPTQTSLSSPECGNSLLMSCLYSYSLHIKG